MALSKSEVFEKLLLFLLIVFISSLNFKKAIKLFWKDYSRFERIFDISYVIAGISILSIIILIFKQFWELNKNLGAFLKKLGDNSYP